MPLFISPQFGWGGYAPRQAYDPIGAQQQILDNVVAFRREQAAKAAALEEERKREREKYRLEGREDWLAALDYDRKLGLQVQGQEADFAKAAYLTEADRRAQAERDQREAAKAFGLAEQGFGFDQTLQEQRLAADAAAAERGDQAAMERLQATLGNQYDISMMGELAQAERDRFQAGQDKERDLRNFGLDTAKGEIGFGHQKEITEMGYQHGLDLQKSLYGLQMEGQELAAAQAKVDAMTDFMSQNEEYMTPEDRNLWKDRRRELQVIQSSDMLPRQRMQAYNQWTGNLAQDRITKRFKLPPTAQQIADKSTAIIDGQKYQVGLRNGTPELKELNSKSQALELHSLEAARTASLKLRSDKAKFIADRLKIMDENAEQGTKTPRFTLEQATRDADEFYRDDENVLRAAYGLPPLVAPQPTQQPVQQRQQAPVSPFSELERITAEAENVPNMSEAEKQAWAQRLLSFSKSLIQPADTLSVNPTDTMSVTAPQMPQVQQPQGVMAPVQIQNDAEFDRLPSGAIFIGPDGKKRRKP